MIALQAVFIKKSPDFIGPGIQILEEIRLESEGQFIDEYEVIVHFT